MKDLIALVVDLGLGASALYLANSLNATVKQLAALIKNLAERVDKLEKMSE